MRWLKLFGFLSPKPKPRKVAHLRAYPDADTLRRLQKAGFTHVSVYCIECDEWEPAEPIRAFWVGR